MTCRGLRIAGEKKRIDSADRCLCDGLLGPCIRRFPCHQRRPSRAGDQSLAAPPTWTWPTTTATRISGLHSNAKVSSPGAYPFQPATTGIPVVHQTEPELILTRARGRFTQQGVQRQTVSDRTGTWNWHGNRTAQPVGENTGNSLPFRPNTRHVRSGPLGAASSGSHPFRKDSPESPHHMFSRMINYIYSRSRNKKIEA